ncbi:hypothetical protein G7046_g143 [Stylonectria norvegica]|nr:hypothetical protein G7046_g143 [Stylonectria norvegica]
MIVHKGIAPKHGATRSTALRHNEPGRSAHSFASDCSTSPGSADCLTPRHPVQLSSPKQRAHDANIPFHPRRSDFYRDNSQKSGTYTFEAGLWSLSWPPLAFTLYSPFCRTLLLTITGSFSVRRVRCDRLYLCCQRCTSTGRKCDGYPAGTLAFSEGSTSRLAEQNPLRRRYDSLELRPVLAPSILSLDARLHHSLHYFQNKTALEFAGYFDNDIWSTLVPQISHREICVRQMVVALSLLHENFHLDHGNVCRQSAASALRQQAVGEYSKGVALLNQHISAQGWAHLEITLLCSILCVTFEWLRGDYLAAHTHLRSTILIMTQWHEDKASLANSTSFWSPSGYMIRTKLRPVCTSLVLQARTMPTDLKLPWQVPLDVQGDIKPFTSIQQARDSLDILLAYIVPETVSKTGQIGNKQRRDVALRLAQWSQLFSKLLANEGKKNASNPRVAIMSLWHVTAGILLATGFLRDEKQFDKYFPEFNVITDKVEDLLSSSTTQFSVDIGVVPLLYYVALKCRHPKVRRRAIAMLRATPRREAVWDSIGAACVAQEVVDAEEEGLGPVENESDIPRYSRVCDLHIITDVEHRRIQIKFMRHGDSDWSSEKVLTW